MENVKEFVEEKIEEAGGTTITETEDEVIEGTLDVEGNVTLKKNLKVEGYLDAPNIRGCSKGLYRTREELVAKYPRPHKGWWAVLCERGEESETVVGQLWMVDLDEYQKPYWYNTQETVSLDGLISQFSDIDNALADIAAIQEGDKTRDAWLEALTEWVQAAYDEVEEEVDEVRRGLVISAEGVDEGILHLNARLLDIADETEPNKRAGRLIEVSGSVDTSGIYETIQEAQDTANLAVEKANKAQSGVDTINNRLSDYEERKEHWDGAAEQLESGRVNNGTERFDGVVCSDETHVEIYTSMDDDPDAKGTYAGVIWLCKERMFTAYNTYAVTPTSGEAYLLYRCYKHWDNECLYMAEPATADGLWKDKVYIGEGHLWMWKRCYDNLCLAGAAGDYEIITNEEIDEMLADFQFAEPSAAGVSSITVSATEPIVGSASAPDAMGNVNIALSITEATEEEIEGIFE